ncbi:MULTISPECIES: LPS translocon maturation chaperone LptM [unclassified Lonepinella]
MKKTIFLTALLVLATFIIGCGVKGPLYYPQENTQQTQQK